MTEYSESFYTGRESRAVTSARTVAPIVASYLKPKSMIDIGCGSGSWCAAFQEQGATEVLGIDGPWAAAHNKTPFLPFDFSTAAMPFKPDLPRKEYDLAISLEFIEHINPDRADAIADFLTSISPVLLIGGAVPGQGGTGHVNEQWPAYWQAKFAQRGYEACDFLRPLIWDNQDVQTWYRQNTVAYFRGGVPKALQERLMEEARRRLAEPQALIHPEIFASKVSQMSIKRRVRTALGRVRRRLIPG